MTGRDLDGQRQPDWPASLAAQHFKAAFLNSIFQSPYADEALKRFYRALINPTETRRLTAWLDAFDTGTRETSSEWKLFGEEAGTPPRDPWKAALPEEQVVRVKLLFENLLGVALMRPVIGSKPTESSIFYAAIDHDLLDTGTKQLILDSVIVPPKKGSVGRCLARADRLNCVSVSFGDYAGVVEWQDLVQGQISILMVSDAARSGATDAREEVSLVFMAFFPLARVFDDDQSALGSLGSLDERGKPWAGFLSAARKCMTQLCQEGVELSDLQDAVRRDEQLRLAMPKASRHNIKGVSEFAQLMPQVIVPKRFTQLPVPLKAAAAIVVDSDPSHSDEYHLAHLRITAQALEECINEAAPYLLRSYLYNTGRDGLGRLFPESRWPGTESTRPKLLSAAGLDDDHLLVFPTPGEDSDLIWWLHTPPGSPGWPSPAKSHLLDLLAPLRAILKITHDLSGWGEHSDFHQIDGVWRNPSVLYSEFKLRDNLAERYFSLVSRLLFASTEADFRRRQTELAFLLKICASFEALGHQCAFQTIERACGVAEQLRAQLSNRTDILGATACIRFRHRIDWEEPRHPQSRRTQLERLLSFLQIQTMVSEGGSRIQLERDNDLWNDSESGQDYRGFVLELISCDKTSGTLVGRLSGQGESHALRARRSDQFVVQTDIHPERVDRWTADIVRALRDMGPARQSTVLDDRLMDYLKWPFRSLSEARESTTNSIQAKLIVACEDEAAFSSYEEKLRPLSNLFRVTLEDQYRTTKAIAEASLAAYARGASHFLKNEITSASLLLGGKPADLRNRINADTIPLRTSDRRLIQGLLTAASAVEGQLQNLKEQAHLFYWVMDPGRVEKDLRDADEGGDHIASSRQTRPLDATMAWCFLEAFQLAIDRLAPPELSRIAKGRCSEAMEWKTTLSTQVALCRQDYLEGRNTEGWRDSIPRLRSSVLSRLSVRVVWPTCIPGCTFDGRTSRIVYAVLVELFQNALKAAFRSKEEVDEPFVSISVERVGHNDIDILVSNSALMRGIEEVSRFLGPDRDRSRHEEQAHGLAGLWQLDLLCNNVARGRVQLQEPIIDKNRLSMAVRVCHAPTSTE